MLYEQEYTIRYAGDGISPWCDIPFKLMRELFDLFGISGARLHWMSRQQVCPCLSLFSPGPSVRQSFSLLICCS